MLNFSVFPDWTGAWLWEILDEGDTYLRCERSFEREQDALEDLEKASHLVRSLLNVH
ncbi:MAG: hypothetical protein PSY12_02270 [bacterium]|nr:hypothetical protein [bacterium]